MMKLNAHQLTCVLSPSKEGEKYNYGKRAGIIGLHTVYTFRVSAQRQTGEPNFLGKTYMFHSFIYNIITIIIHPLLGLF